LRVLVVNYFILSPPPRRLAVVTVFDIRLVANNNHIATPPQCCRGCCCSRWEQWAIMRQWWSCDARGDLPVKTDNELPLTSAVKRDHSTLSLLVHPFIRSLFYQSATKWVAFVTQCL